ncbi:GNAT family N-acetyltransferase [Streptomyces sp. NPDC001455]|uniref:GNAT family N-acetyltransferase n=1 Tax=unclassified Streptomyces TaxID=2593676 RepID=UPI00331BE15F
MATPTLNTERLLLEPYSPADEEAFVELFQDTRVSRWMGDGTKSEAEDRAMFQRVFSKVYAQELFDVWAVRHDGRLIGHAEIKPTEEVSGHELVYALEPDAWGHGFGTEIARALIAYGHDVLGLTEVHATVAAENTASLVLLDRLGFRYVRDITEDDGTTTRVLTRSAAADTADEAPEAAAGQPL